MSAMSLGRERACPKTTSAAAPVSALKNSLVFSFKGLFQSDTGFVVLNTMASLKSSAPCRGCLMAAWLLVYRIRA